jgi:hypothetical protein
MAGVAVVTAWQVGGCGGGLASLIPEQPVDFALGSGLGQFEVTAGQPAAKTGTGSFDLGEYSVGRGSVELNPNVITVTPSASSGNKGTVNLQQTTTLEITVWIAASAEIDTVCEAGEQYGPYNVTLDEDYVPVAIDPPQVTLSQSTLDLLNGGEFSLCIQVVSPVDGTVTIESLTFNLGG